jgi:uncharacterized protein
VNFDVEKRTILLVRHGSHAYGLNTPTSDEDFKGVCVKPKEAYFGFTQKFEQHEHMGSKHGDGVDKVIYSLEKFAALAADCNPSIVEVLHVADEDVLVCDAYGEILRKHKDEFISKRARWSFAGYAHGQLKRIKTHRKWLLDPPKAPPTRQQFGLSETMKVSKSELGAYDAVLSQGIELELPKNVITLFTREKQYQAEKTHYDQYLNWLKTRNPARAELEAKYHYDTKHGMHLIRLLLMCKEILATGTVHVKRLHDRDKLLGIRNGSTSYDALVEEAERLEVECEALYETSTLPKEPNRARLDEIIIEMTDSYLRFHG